MENGQDSTMLARGLEGKLLQEIIPGEAGRGKLDEAVLKVRREQCILSLELESWSRTDPGLLEAIVIPEQEGKICILIRSIYQKGDAAHQLRETEQLYKLLSENMSDYIWTMDMEFNLTYISPSVERVLGFTPDEMMKRTLKENLHPNSLKQAFKVYLEELENEKKGGADHNRKRVILLEHIRKDDGYVPIEVTITFLRTPEGLPDGILGISRDISDRAKAEKYARESETKYRTILDNIEDGYFEIDRGGSFTFVNHSLEGITGYSGTDMLGKTYENFVHETEVPGMRKLFQDIDRNERPSRVVNWKFRTPDGREVYVEASLSLTRNREGHKSGICGIVRDVTERKSAEDALKISEEKYRTILQSIEDGYFEVDLTGNIVFFNEALTRILGFSSQELMGMNYRSFMDGINKRKVFREFIRMYKTGTSASIIDLEFIRKDQGVRYLEGSVSLIRDLDRKAIGFRGIVRDVTERREAEEALRRSEESLRARNALIEKDLQTAQLIQKALVGGKIPKSEDLIIDYRYYPLEAVGGDFFSLTPLREGGLGVFIGDVSSHGVTAALFLSLIKATTDRICRIFAHMPAEYISQMNHELLGNMPYSFLTATYGYFIRDDEGVMKFVFSSAGHPGPLLYRAESSHVDVVNSRGTLIGMLEDIKNDQREVVLRRGDRIFLYTDGIPETKNRKGDLLGYDELSRLVEEASRTSLGETLDAIIEEVNRFRDEEPLDDDIVLIGFEIK